MNELFERELINTTINDVSLADYVKENYVPMSVIEDIKAEIQQEADNSAQPYEMSAYYHCLQIIDKHCGKENE